MDMDDIKTKRSFSVATWVAKQKANVVLYTSFFVALLWVWHFASDGDYSFLMVRME